MAGNSAIGLPAGHLHLNVVNFVMPSHAILHRTVTVGITGMLMQCIVLSFVPLVLKVYIFFASRDYCIYFDEICGR